MGRYYVYTLTDPRDGAVFYVGKGCGDRIEAHEREARKGVYSAKCQRIREVEAAGLRVTKQKVAWFATERAAYEHEAALIAALPNLTNGGAVTRTHISWQRKLVRLAIKALCGELAPTGPWSLAIAKVLTVRAPSIVAKHGPFGA